jgi:hypothetical protein
MIKGTILAGLLTLAIMASGQTTLDTALNFSVKDTEGNTLDLYDILEEGMIVVIDFFSTA